MEEGRRAAHIISWFGLQAALLNVLRPQHLTLNKALVGVEQGGPAGAGAAAGSGGGAASTSEQQQNQGGGARLMFQDGSTVHAGIVVGADGNMSSVRAALFGGEQPQFIGTAFWRSMVHPLPEGWPEKPGVLCSWSTARTGKLVAIRTFQDHLSVSAASGWPEDRLQELWQRAYFAQPADAPQQQQQQQQQAGDQQHHQQQAKEGQPSPAAGAPPRDPSAKRARFLELFGSEFPPRVVKLLAEADPSTLIEHGVYWRDPGKAWGAGSVTLVGDAAHVMPPNLGQGTSLAFEGAYELARELAHVPAESVRAGDAAAQQALRRYEERQRARVAPISLASAGNARQFYQEKDGKASPMIGSSDMMAMQKFIMSRAPLQPLQDLASSAVARATA